MNSVDFESMSELSSGLIVRIQNIVFKVSTVCILWIYGAELSDKDTFILHFTINLIVHPQKNSKKVWLYMHLLFADIIFCITIFHNAD